MSTYFIKLVLISSVLWSLTSSGENGIQIGKEKSTICEGCHGPNGISSNELWPNLAGQKKGYLIKTLIDYKNGAREDAVMSSMSLILSQEDIIDISTYYASLEGGN